MVPRSQISLEQQRQIELALVLVEVIGALGIDFP